MSRKKKKAASAASEEAAVETLESPVEESTPGTVASEETVVEEPAPETPVADEPAASEEDLAAAIPAEDATSGDVPTEETSPEEGESPDEAPSGGDAPPIPLKRIVEAILFASQKPVSAKELISVLRGAAEDENENPATIPFKKIKEPALRVVLDELMDDCLREDRTYEVRESAAGWQLVTRPDFAPWLRQLYPENRSARLSAPALETLAIIAYRQPITRADIEAVRGVAVDGVMQTLLDRGLVKIAGRAEIPGRPLLYETTQNFMEHFGLKNLDDLPNSAELRKISLPTAEIPKETPAATPENTPAESPAASEGGQPEGAPAEDVPAAGEIPAEEPIAGETPVADEAPVEEILVVEEAAIEETSAEDTASENPDNPAQS